MTKNKTLTMSARGYNQRKKNHTNTDELQDSNGKNEVREIRSPSLRALTQS